MNREVFDQLTELDEGDDTYEFSREMVEAYITQAAKTFKEMDQAVYVFCCPL